MSNNPRASKQKQSRRWLSIILMYKSATQQQFNTCLRAGYIKLYTVVWRSFAAFPYFFAQNFLRMNLIEELQWRGMIQDIMPGTEDQLKKK